MTVTGKTLAENMAAMDVPEPDSRVIHPVSSPRSPTGGLVILRGNLAPDGCVVKGAGHERLTHRGPARVFGGGPPQFPEKRLAQFDARFRYSAGTAAWSPASRTRALCILHNFSTSGGLADSPNAAQMAGSPNGRLPKWQSHQMAESQNGRVPRRQSAQMAESPRVH